jgi:hypothetical protein
MLRFELQVCLATHEDMRSTGCVRRLFDHFTAGLSDFVQQGPPEEAECFGCTLAVAAMRRATPTPT